MSTIASSSSESEEDDGTFDCDEFAGFEDAVSREQQQQQQQQAPETKTSPSPLEEAVPTAIKITSLQPTAAVQDKPHSDVPLLSMPAQTALPEGCFQLTKINKQGTKITVLARANHDGEIITIEEDEEDSKELLGDMDEVMVRLHELKEPNESSSASMLKGASSASSATCSTTSTTNTTTTNTTNTTNRSLSSVSAASVPVRTKTQKRDRVALEHLQQTQDIHAHKDAIWVIKFEPVITVGSRFFLATGGQDAVVRVWSCERMINGNNTPKHGKKKNIWTENFGKYESFKENSKWKINEIPHCEYIGHTSDVVDLAWSPTATIGEHGGRYLLSASIDKSVRLWHTSHSECLCTFAHPKSVTSVDFHPAKTGRLRFLTGCFDCKLRVWDVESGKVQQWTQVQNIVTAACFRPDGALVVVGLINGVCIFLHYDGLKFYTQVDCRNRRGKHRKGRKVTGLQWSTKNDRTLLVSTNDSRMRMLRTTDFAQVMKYKGATNETMQIHGTFSPDGNHIVSGSENGSVVLWRTNHDWYQPGRASSVGYSKNKNDSYESFEMTNVSSCTATAFMPFMTTVRDAVVSSAKRKLASGIISESEFAEIIMSQAKHDMKMSEDDDAGAMLSGRRKTDGVTSSVSIVAADAVGRLKMYVSGYPTQMEDSGAIVEASDEMVVEVEEINKLVVAIPPLMSALSTSSQSSSAAASPSSDVSIEQPDTPPPLPPPRRSSLKLPSRSAENFVQPPLPPR